MERDLMARTSSASRLLMSSDRSITSEPNFSMNSELDTASVEGDVVVS